MHLPLFGYVGPETLVPLASGLAAVIGGLLAFGRTGWSLCFRAIRYLFGRRDDAAVCEKADDEHEDLADNRKAA